VNTAKGPAIAAIVIFTIFLGVSALVTFTSFSLPKPADWLESWFKLFQTSVTIVVGLKIASNIDSVVAALAGRSGKPGSGD
jgi:hypothetical protein